MYTISMRWDAKEQKGYVKMTGDNRLDLQLSFITSGHRSTKGLKLISVKN